MCKFVLVLGFRTWGNRHSVCSSIMKGIELVRTQNVKAEVIMKSYLILARVKTAS